MGRQHSQILLLFDAGVPASLYTAPALERTSSCTITCRLSTVSCLKISFKKTFQRCGLPGLAHVLLKAGRAGDAKQQYRRMLAIQPNNPNALNDLSYLMAQSGENFDEALTLARRGTQFATDQNLKNSLQDTLGSIYLKKNMYDSALQSFQVAVNNNPASMTFRCHLGAAPYQMGNNPGRKPDSRPHWRLPQSRRTNQRFATYWRGSDPREMRSGQPQSTLAACGKTDSLAVAAR